MIKWLTLIALPVLAQNSQPVPSMVYTQLQYFGITYHPGGGYPANDFKYPNALDQKGYVVVSPGAQMDVEYFPWPKQRWIGFKSIHAVFKDCMDLWSGHHHLGPRFYYHPSASWQLAIGIGPTLIWRGNWWKYFPKDRKLHYRGDPNYGYDSVGGNWQSAWIWYGGNLEASYMFNQHWGAVYSLVPGFPQVLTSGFGLRYGF